MHSSEVYEHRDSIQRMVYLQCGKCVDAPPLLAVGVSCSTSRFCQALADHGNSSVLLQADPMCGVSAVL